MNPKKVKDYIGSQAQKEGIPEEDMEIIVLAYYKLLRDCLSSLKDTTVQVLGMGTMQVRQKYLSVMIQKIKEDESLENWDRNKQLEPLLRLSEQFKVDREKRMFDFQQRKEYKRGIAWKKKYGIKDEEDTNEEIDNSQPKEDDIKGEVSEGLGE